MTTTKDPGTELDARPDPAPQVEGNPPELAQARVTPIEVPRPGVGQTVEVNVIAGRPLKLGFATTDVKTREVVKDDLVLEFDNGGKVILKDYMTAFGQLGEIRTTIILPDGKHYPFTELLAPTTGARQDRAAPGTAGDAIIIQKPPAGEKQSVKLTTEKPMALNFGFGQIESTAVDKDGNLVLTFKDKAVLVLEGYAALKDNKDFGLYFAKGDKIALGDLAPSAGPEESESARFSEFGPGGTLGPLDHLGPLPPLPFTLIPPPGPPGSPPPEFPPPPPECPTCDEGPTYFISGPPCLVEEVDPSFTVGVSALDLSGNQTRSVDIRVEFLALQPGHGAASFDDFVGGADFLFLALQAAAAAETGITVTDLGNGAVRITFAANASSNQLTFDLLAVDDGLDEPIEDFRFVLSNEQVTNGADPGTIVAGPGTSFVDSQILDVDEYQVTIGDAVGFEGDPLVFDITLSNPSDEAITLDLAAVPLTTIDTGPATPGVDFVASNFEVSTDGGATWQPAGGPDGRTVTFAPGETALMVRIATLTDGAIEGDESFRLTVANRDQLHACDVTNIVDGAGYIFDGGDCPPPEWFVCGPPCLIEEVDPAFTVGVSQLALDSGQTRSIDVRVVFDSFHTGHDAASFDDLGGANFLYAALAAAAAEETGITVQNLGNGAARVTFAADASTTALEFDLLPSGDAIDENVEDFRIVLENSQATGGAPVAVVVPGEGTSYVESHIVESDEYSIDDVCADACDTVRDDTSACDPPVRETCDPPSWRDACDPLSSGPRQDWGGPRESIGASATLAAQAAMAAFIGLPLAEQFVPQVEDRTTAGWNEAQSLARHAADAKVEPVADGNIAAIVEACRAEFERGAPAAAEGERSWHRGEWHDAVLPSPLNGGVASLLADLMTPQPGIAGPESAPHVAPTLIGGELIDLPGAPAAPPLYSTVAALPPALDDLAARFAALGAIAPNPNWADPALAAFSLDESGVLDLSTLGQPVQSERGDGPGPSGVDVKLTLQDVLSLTDEGHQLTIVGASGDTVTADFSGHSVAVTDLGAFTRYVIDGGAATVDIDNQVQKNIVGI